MTLGDAPAGARAIVSAVEGTGARVDKLAALGILPGVEVLIQQRTPVVVIECGETVLALEHELARGIVVKLL
jgi:Fe2+ transport system protein FeoA